MTPWKHLFDKRQKDARLPSTRPSRDDMELSLCSTVTANGRADHKFVLMCLPFLRWAKKLHQVDMCNLQSDQVFFLSLRKQYSLVRKSRPWKSFARFRRVDSLDFVKVSDSVRVLHKNICDILHKFLINSRHYTPSPPPQTPGKPVEVNLGDELTGYYSSSGCTETNLWIFKTAHQYQINKTRTRQSTITLMILCLPIRTHR